MFGRKPAHRQPPPPPPTEELSSLVYPSVSHGRSAQPKNSLRRNHGYAFNRLYIPSLIVDQTFLLLRQAGTLGRERFLIWSGTILDEAAVVSSVQIPAASASRLHGEIAAPVMARLFDALDSRDLVPLAQLHTHPYEPIMSDVDAERPAVAQAGFLSIILPNFGFLDPARVEEWGAYEYQAKLQWHELSHEEKKQRLIIDDSIIWIS